MLEIRLGDIVQLKKQQPCERYEWQVMRLGADIGIKCQKCHHKVLLERQVMERRIKGFVKRVEG